MVLPLTGKRDKQRCFNDVKIHGKILEFWASRFSQVVVLSTENAYADFHRKNVNAIRAPISIQPPL